MSSGASIVRNSAFALATQLTTAAFTAVLTLYLVRALDPSGYGIFALALAIGGLLTVPADFGVSQAAARFIAERRGDREAVGRVLADALRLKLFVTGGVSLALIAAAGPIAGLYGEPGLTWPLRGVALALFGQSLLLLFSASFAAQGRVDRNLIAVLAESAVETAASIALVVAGTGAAGAAFGRATGYAVGAAFGLALTARLVGRGALAIGTRRARGQGLGRYAGALAIVDSAYTLFDQIDVLLIGAFLGTASVGLFQAPMRLAAFLFYPGYALASGVAPRLARREGEQPNVRAFSVALRVSFLAQAALTAVIVAWAEPIVDLLLGSDYEGSSEVLRALGPYVFFAGFGVLVSLGANYLGEARKRIPIALTAIALNVALDIALIPQIGIVAGAIGTDVAYGFYVVAHLRLCARSLAMPLTPIVATAARSLAAGTVMAGVLLLFGHDHVSATMLAVGGVTALAVYILVLVLLREVTLAELAALGRKVRRAARRHDSEDA